jgi:diguanylate cyclase (GGDEF)-like protein/PAS domain S-box-containing protein
MNSGVEEQTRRLFSMVEIFLVTCDRWMEANPDSDPRIDPVFGRLIEDFWQKTNKTIEIRFVMEDGGLFFAHAPSTQPLANVRDREYVKGALAMQQPGLYIGNPIVGRVSERPVLPIAMRLKHPSRGINLVFASIDLNALVTMYEEQRAKPDGAIVLVRRDGIVLARSPSEERLLGYSVAKGKIFSQLLPRKPRDLTLLEPTATDGIKKFASYSSMTDYPLVLVVSSGYEDVLGHWRRQVLVGILIALCVTIAAIAAAFRSARLLALLDHRATELRVAATAFESQEGILVTDEKKTILRVNHAFSEITGYLPDEVIGKDPSLFKSGQQDKAFYTKMWNSIRQNGFWQGEIINRRKNGETFPEWLTVTAVKDEAGQITNYVATLTDITHRKRAEDEINSLAFYDPLTKLPNRRLLFDRLMRSRESSAANEKFGALVLIDLDNFKTLNDNHGHDIGDLLLQQIAKSLSACVREGDTVARLGGDEFVLLLENLSESSQEAARLTEAMAMKSLNALNNTYQLGNIEHRTSASIGATLFLGVQTSIDDLLKQADLAMYDSKEKGRNTLRFFDPVMQTIVRKRAALDAGLRTAIDENQFLLHYQAQVAGEGRVMGVEVLLRWQHPQHGMVPPLDFIPLAEETGLILPLGNWVLETACAQLARWASQPDLAHLTIAVNVSAKQFRESDFVDTVLAVVSRTGANPRRLKLELTESLLVTDVDDIIEKMYDLKAKGVGFSLDDFGTGYSSLFYLKRLPLDQLKIDKTFVRDILIDPNDAAIARTIVTLADSLGLGVIAEGVETEAQKDCLVHLGCHFYQGYLFSRPLPLPEFEAFARKA